MTKEEKLQEIFTTAWNGLKSQGFERSIIMVPASISTDSMIASCRYRGPDGMRCAIGWCIPDEAYDTSIEGRSAGHDSILRILGVETENHDDNEYVWMVGALSRLQSCHDNADEFNGMEKELRFFAEEYKLQVP